MKKTLRLIGKILLSIILVVAIALLGFQVYDRIKHHDFYANADAAFKTPAVHEGFVQQGFDYVEEDEVFLATGYMSNDKASRVYVLDKNGSVLSYTELQKSSGKDYKGHTGGIERFGKFLYITGGSGLDVFPYAEVLSGAASVKQLGTFTTYNDPAYCYIQNGYMLTGSFYDEGAYETPAHERMTTENGDNNMAMMTVFKLNENAKFGISPNPVAVVSTRGQVQGICFTDDNKIVLSTSYGLSTSQLCIYDLATMTTQANYRFTGCTESGVEFDFTRVTLCVLDSANLVQVIKAPPMSEELVYLDGKIYIMNESACNKYVFGKITTGTDIYAYNYR